MTRALPLWLTVAALLAALVACGTGETRTVFRVLKIEPRRIIVEREGIKLEIQMK